MYPAYGATSCSDIFILGNREQGMAVTTVDVKRAYKWKMYKLANVW